jgi:hypothetical protein
LFCLLQVGAPPFDERYEGYGRNKIAWIRNLSLLGFTFHACPLGYLLHQPHAPSAALGEFKARRMETIIALDERAAAEVRADPRGAVWKHAPGYATADLCMRRGRGDGNGEDTRSHSEREASLRTQQGRWRTVAAAAAAQDLLTQVADALAGDGTVGAVRLRLEQLFYLQHEYIRDETLLRPSIVPLHGHSGGDISGSEQQQQQVQHTVWAATHATLEYVPQLESLLATWAGPASVALVVAAQSELRAARRAAEALSKITTHPLRVTAIIADWRSGGSDTSNSSSSGSGSGIGGLMYPSNLARKVAFDAVPGPAWVWLLDADLCPCVAARCEENRLSSCLSHHCLGDSSFSHRNLATKTPM